MAKKQPLWRRFLSNEKDEIVLWQKPNLPLTVWIEAVVLTDIITSPSWLHKLFSTVSFGSIFTWAWLEIASGVSPFRRALGGIVMIAVIYSRVR